MQMAMQTFRNDVTGILGRLSTSLAQASQSVLSQTIDDVRTAATNAGAVQGGEASKVGEPRSRGGN